MSILSNIDMLIEQDAYITKDDGLNRLSINGIREHISKIEKSNDDLLVALESTLVMMDKICYQDTIEGKNNILAVIDEARGTS